MSIGIVGCGAIVRQSHLPAYRKAGYPVAGVYDPSPEALATAHSEFGVRGYPSLEALLDDPAVTICDVATHAAIRPPLVAQCLRAGKHVLSQKPFAPTVAAARELVELAERQGLRLAVNQNGRWSPPWRLAREQISAGAVGRVTSVTHLFEPSFAFVPNSPFDAIPHWMIYDYAIHWMDITRCWMGEARPVRCRAREFRPPHQTEGVQPWSGWIEFEYPDGESAMIRCVGAPATQRLGHPFWIHGTEGTLRGSVLDNDYLELESGDEATSFPMDGAWFPDGFIGTMSELMRAIHEGGEPSNSGRHNLLTLEMTLAAVNSAERDGEAVEVKA